MTLNPSLSTLLGGSTTMDPFCCCCELRTQATTDAIQMESDTE